MRDSLMAILKFWWKTRFRTSEVLLSLLFIAVCFSITYLKKLGGSYLGMLFFMGLVLHFWIRRLLLLYLISKKYKKLWFERVKEIQVSIDERSVGVLCEGKELWFDWEVADSVLFANGIWFLKWGRTYCLFLPGQVLNTEENNLLDLKSKKFSPIGAS